MTALDAALGVTPRRAGESYWAYLSRRCRAFDRYNRAHHYGTFGRSAWRHRRRGRA